MTLRSAFIVPEVLTQLSKTRQMFFFTYIFREIYSFPTALTFSKSLRYLNRTNPPTCLITVSNKPTRSDGKESLKNLLDVNLIRFYNILSPTSSVRITVPLDRLHRFFHSRKKSFIVLSVVLFYLKWQRHQPAINITTRNLKLGCRMTDLV